ncbi:hypothetical protein T01_10029 [Trichinella spiralis]|uniref:Uncharacterized protein n=1 Tax=Trichinella spiralis TaxID=6334 RepID=A0A0V1BEL0_TRISP|nr:hypothetical protein T01_10029 [Trichinella spiralis]
MHECQGSVWIGQLLVSSACFIVCWSLMKEEKVGVFWFHVASQVNEVERQKLWKSSFVRYNHTNEENQPAPSALKFRALDKQPGAVCGLKIFQTYAREGERSICGD